MHQINSLEDLQKVYKAQKDSEKDGVILRILAFVLIIAIITVIYGIFP